MRAAWLAAATLLLTPGGGHAESPGTPEPLHVLIGPERTLKLALSLSDHKSKLEGSKASKGVVLNATVTAPLWDQGCKIVLEGARATLRVEDASAPLSGGKPGFLLLVLAELTFADGVSRKLPGGYFCRTGTDKSDQGKVLVFLPRKGGKAMMKDGDTIEVPVSKGSNGPPPECGGAAPAAPAKEPPAPFAVDLPVSICSK